MSLDMLTAAFLTGIEHMHSAFCGNTQMKHWPCMKWHCMNSWNSMKFKTLWALSGTEHNNSKWLNSFIKHNLTVICYFQGNNSKWLNSLIKLNLNIISYFQPKCQMWTNSNYFNQDGCKKLTISKYGTAIICNCLA